MLGIPYTGSGPSACARCWDKVLAKHLMRDGGIPTPDFYAFSAAAFRDLGAAEALPAIEERLGLPDRRQAGRAAARRWASSSPPRPRQVPGALVAAFSYDRKVLLESTSPGHDLAVSIVDGQALPVVEAVPNDEGLLRLRGALRDRPHDVRVPRRAQR